jgi:hypothetical protein
LIGVGGDDAWKKLNEACRVAKSYALRKNKIVIVLAQLSDEGALKYAKGMLDHFDNAFFFVANEQTKEQGIVHVTQPKARNQDPSPFDLGLEYEYMSIAEEDRSDDATPIPKPMQRRKRNGKQRNEEKESSDYDENETPEDRTLDSLTEEEKERIVVRVENGKRTRYLDGQRISKHGKRSSSERVRRKRTTE